MMTRGEAIELFRSDDLIGIAMQADSVRKRLHPDGIVTFFLENQSDLPASDVATITFTSDDTVEQRIEQYETTRRAQEQTGALISFAVRFVNNGGEEATAAEYLRSLAIARIYLDNIPHLQTSSVVGSKLCQIALRFGANDIDAAAASPLGMTEERLRCLIRDAGFIPKRRDARYHLYSLS
jgi:cyclic dehypoxanthinyl futalosine synthase